MGGFLSKPVSEAILKNTLRRWFPGANLGDEESGGTAIADGDAGAVFRLMQAAGPEQLARLVDLMLEDGTACDLMQKLQAKGLAAQILVYSAHTAEAKVLETLRAGASGYIIKGSSPQRLIDAINTVAKGGSYLDPAIASGVMGRVGRTKERRASHSRELTERETTVLNALVQGKRNKDIAGELFITERTVKYHVNALFTKLRVQNRTQAVTAAIEQGLVSI